MVAKHSAKSSVKAFAFSCIFALSSSSFAMAADAPTNHPANSPGKHKLTKFGKKLISARFFAKQPSDPSALSYPPAPPAPAGQLVPPPGETPYYPVRKDGQPYVLDQELNNNITGTLNRKKWTPEEDALVHSDYDTASMTGRAQRAMSSWPEENEFSVYRVGTRINKMFERWMGFDPYEFR